MVVVALLAATYFAWPDGVDDRRIVDDLAQRQAAVDEPARETLLGRTVPATAFARRARAAGWRPVGIHDLTVHGRDAVTLVWERGGRRAVHSSLTGPPLARPEGSGRTGRSGILLYGLEGDLRTVVTWTEGGESAVLSAADLSLGELYELAGGPRAQR